MEWLENVIDACLARMAQTTFPTMMFPGDIPAAMLDPSIPVRSGCQGWKPIVSTITDDDINQFENKIGHPLPLSYRAYLKYKHFYSLRLPDHAVNLPDHLPDNFEKLDDLIFHCYEPELLIGRNYIYFADFNDYGLLCFDADKPMPENEYPVVYIDHEDLEFMLPYAINFRELMEADEEAGNRFIDRLNNMRTIKDFPSASRKLNSHFFKDRK